MRKLFFETLKNTIMKKITTLLFFISAFAVSSFAQKNYDRNYNRNYNDEYAGVYSNNHSSYSKGKYNNVNHFNEIERNRQINIVNDEYQSNVMSIRYNRYMNRHQKKIAIRKINNDRDRQINMINTRYNSQFDFHRNRYH